MSVRTLALGMALLLVAAVAATAQMTDYYSTPTGKLPSSHVTSRVQPETFTWQPPAQAMRTGRAQPITVVINDQRRQYDPPAMMSQDHVLVPMRGIFEDVNATVQWDGNRQLVTAKTAEGKTISMNVGSTTALVEGRPVTLEAPAQIHQRRVFVPLRFVCEATGYPVAWEESGRRVLIASRPGTTLAGAELCPAPRLAMAPPEPLPEVAPPPAPEAMPAPQPIPLTCCPPPPAVATCPEPCPMVAACPEACPVATACPTSCPYG